MYCKKCGKEIDYEATVCHECEEAEALASQAAPEEVAVAEAAVEAPVAAAPSNRMFGFPKALVGAIMGVVAFVLFAIAYMVVAGSLTEILEVIDKAESGFYSGMGQAYIENMVKGLLEDAIMSVIIAIGCFIVSLVLGILAIVFGAKSIKAFKSVKEGGKPIVTLILGIISLAMGICAVVTVGLVFAGVALGLMSALSMMTGL